MLPLLAVFYKIFESSGIDALLEASSEGPIAYLVYGLMLFFYLFLLYLTFYYVIDRSVSSRIMIEIEKSQAKEMRFEELIRIYSIDTKYKDQIDGMLGGGFIKEEAGKYKCTLKGFLVAKVAYFFKKMLRLGVGG